MHDTSTSTTKNCALDWAKSSEVGYGSFHGQGGRIAMVPKDYNRVSKSLGVFDTAPQNKISKIFSQL